MIEELKFTLVEEQRKAMNELLKEMGVRHFKLITDLYGELDVVQYKEYQRLEEENQKLRDEIMELQEYKKAVYEINKYINAYSPYFLETQEQNNQTIATIIHNIGDYNND